MSKPVIGISADVDHNSFFDTAEVNLQYIDAVERAGGVPLVLVSTDKPELACAQLDRVDAVLVTGGDDYHPELFNQSRHPTTRLIPSRRQEHDLVLFNQLWQEQMPALSICASTQGLNIVRGGDLHQHLDHLVDVHDFDAGRSVAHPIQVHEKTLLEQVLGMNQLEVNSRHHQAVNQVGAGLRISAVADDGTVEAIEPIEFVEHPLLAVQWHPERIPDQSHSKQLFDWLINEAIKHQPISVTVVKSNQLSPFF
jgi:putative glutamine amidotransferase